MWLSKSRWGDSSITEKKIFFSLAKLGLLKVRHTIVYRILCFPYSNTPDPAQEEVVNH